MKKITIFVGALAIGLSLAIVGCGEKEMSAGTVAPPTDNSSQIKQIQDNPNMPQAAKDAAIGAIKARAEAAKAQSEAVKSSMKSDK